jgi:hypothetical protein
MRSENVDNAVVVYKGGVVLFHNYDDILASAEKLAEHVKGVVVDEENIKTSKKMLAEINKQVNELEDARKGIKREVLAPYEEFEAKVKTIVNVVKEADAVVRNQVKELEEIERQAKYDEIVALWKRRINRYPELVDMFTYLDFIKPQHSNKTTSMTKVENDMVDWLEGRKNDVEMIKGLEHSDDIMVEYVRTQNVSTAIQTIRERNMKKEELTGKKEIKRSVTITIDGDDLGPVEAFMKSLKINYIIK